MGYEKADMQATAAHLLLMPFAIFVSSNYSIYFLHSSNYRLADVSYAVFASFSIRGKASRITQGFHPFVDGNRAALKFLHQIVLRKWNNRAIPRVRLVLRKP